MLSYKKQYFDIWIYFLRADMTKKGTSQQEHSLPFHNTQHMSPLYLQTFHNTQHLSLLHLQKKIWKGLK